MGASTVSSGWSNHFIELLNIFKIKMPLWLAYDHWTGLSTARRSSHADGAGLGRYVAAGPRKHSSTKSMPSSKRSRRNWFSKPTLYSMRQRFSGRNRLQPPRFLIALVITAILVIGIKESARFNATIVTIKVAVVLFVIGLGIHYVDFSNWGHDWSTFCAHGFLWSRGRSGLHLFRVYRV